MVGNQRGRVRPVASGLRLLPEFTLLVDLTRCGLRGFEQVTGLSQTQLPDLSGKTRIVPTS